ncbi:hypothetical protein FKM82_022351 [Ascaphus truei]
MSGVGWDLAAMKSVFHFVCSRVVQPRPFPAETPWSSVPSLWRPLELCPFPDKGRPVWRRGVLQNIKNPAPARSRASG